MRGVAFKYTFPVSKAERRADGVYITGLASGPEIDGDGERVTVEAIAGFSRQIELAAEMGDPIPYRDAHAKDGVLRDLGVVTKAWITPDFHLGVEVRLDDDNPAAVSLFKQIQKGKQFGMSVAGHVLDFADEYVSEIGKIVRTFKDVVLEEISNTTRPAWYPSLGTVLSKAIKDAEDGESAAAAGDNVDNDELQTEQETTETPAVDENTEPVVEETAAPADATQVPAPEAANDVVGTEAAEEIAGQDTDATQVSPPDVTNDVNNNVAAAGGDALRAERADGPEGPAMNEPTPDVLTDQNPTVEKAVAAFRDLFTTLLREAATGSIAKSVSQDNEPVIAKAVEDATASLTAKVEDLSKSLSEATARIEELENSPAGDDAPELVGKHELSKAEAQQVINSMDPRDRIRLGLREALGR